MSCAPAPGSEAGCISPVGATWLRLFGLVWLHEDGVRLSSPCSVLKHPDHKASCPQAGYELRIGSWEVPERLSPAQAVAHAVDAQVNVCMTYVPSQDPAMLGKRAHGPTGEAGGAQQGRPSGVVWEAAARRQPDRA